MASVTQLRRGTRCSPAGGGRAARVRARVQRRAAAGRRDACLRRAARGGRGVAVGGRRPEVRDPRFQRRRQDHPVQRHHRRLPAHGRADLFLRRGHHRAAAARAHPQGIEAHLPVLAAVSRTQRSRQPVPGGARRVQRPLQLPASALQPRQHRRHAGPAGTRAPVAHRRRAGRQPGARPAAPAGDRHGAGRRAAADPVRRARRRPVAGRAPRTGGTAALAARTHELRADRARPGHRAQRHRACHRHAQRPRAEDRHAERDRERRAGPGHLHGKSNTDGLLVRRRATRRPRARSWWSKAWTSTTAVPMRCKA